MTAHPAPDALAALAEEAREAIERLEHSYWPACVRAGTADKGYVMGSVGVHHLVAVYNYARAALLRDQGEVAALREERDALRSALLRAKPILGAASADPSISNDTKQFRIKIYEETATVLAQRSAVRQPDK